MLVPGRYRQKSVCFTENPNFKNLERLQGILSTLSCKQWNEILETKMEVSDGFFYEAYDFPLVISQSAQSFFSALESAWPAMHLGGGKCTKKAWPTWVCWPQIGGSHIHRPRKNLGGIFWMNILGMWNFEIAVWGAFVGTKKSHFYGQVLGTSGHLGIFCFSKARPVAVSWSSSVLEGWKKKNAKMLMGESGAVFGVYKSI